MVGPRGLGIIALASGDAQERAWALAEGEAYLRQGAVGHHHLFFYRDAMDVKLAERDWDAVERHAAALEDFARSEPLPWREFFAACGRALAAWDRGRRGGAIEEELVRLREEAERAGWNNALPALEQAGRRMWRRV